jgi:hypothetical protein
VHLKDGCVLEESAGAPRGDPDNPLTWEQIADKGKSYKKRWPSCPLWEGVRVRGKIYSAKHCPHPCSLPAGEGTKSMGEEMRKWHGSFTPSFAAP